MAYEDEGLRAVRATYRKDPEAGDVFRKSVGDEICKQVVEEMLSDKVWNNEEETVWTVEITERIKKACKALELKRYKYVVQVTLGEVKKQGVRIASRCLWDTNNDNFSGFSFKNETLWCSAMLFACYTE